MPGSYLNVVGSVFNTSGIDSGPFGIAGLSVVADSLSAMKHARGRMVRDQTGLVTDYAIEGPFPMFGNNDNRVDQLAVWTVSTFMQKLRKQLTQPTPLVSDQRPDVPPVVVEPCRPPVVINPCPRPAFAPPCERPVVWRHHDYWRHHHR